MDIPENSIIEWYEQPSGIRTGIVANMPPVRRIGRVIFRNQRGWLVVSDDNGTRCHVRPDEAIVIAESPEAGWGNLA